MADTPNFRVHWCTSESNARELAEHCERMTAGFRKSWLGIDRASPWAPRCEIVVHNEMNSYVGFLGPGSEQTSGCATIRLDEGRVVFRRIDLRADSHDWRTESLPHELTHVVLADRFSMRRMAPWADEGIAMLSESQGKLERRMAELRRVSAQGALFTARGLVGVRASPQPSSRVAFYGQSVALVSVLLERGTRDQLLRFAEASQVDAPEAALRDVYGTGGWAEVEQRLGEFVWGDRSTSASRTLGASR